MVGKKKKVNFIKSEEGYLILSTIFLLILSAIMVQSIIKISANHIVQLNQISRSYQEKTALNIAENILKDEIMGNNRFIKSAEIVSSVGRIQVSKKSDIDYQLMLITEDNGILTKNIIIESVSSVSNESFDFEESETSRSILLEKENQQEKTLNN